MTPPKHNDDPGTVAFWIRQSAFPLENDEIALLEDIMSKATYQQPISVMERYELVILYWQVVGWLRGTRHARHS